MTPRIHHVQDERLFECYLAGRHGETPDPPTAEHLADCEACAARFAEMARFMDALREEAEMEADEVFTLERLRAQQIAVGRRIDHVGQPARLISFPSQVVRRTMTVSTSHTAPRWIAGAAAAGLFVGLALGASYEWEWRGRPAGRISAVAESTVSRPTVPASEATLVGSSPEPAFSADDAFLLELDAALDRPRTRELLPFDALTPHVREIRNPR